MKKILLLPLLLLSLVGCNKTETIDYEAIDKEIKGCYTYFKYATNLEENSPGFGLTLDRWTNKSLSSIAATGFLLASYPVLVEEGLM